ncbi:MAG: phage terminase large subunit [Chloroflexi bacterium]|nr:phage terminase large subunit [Chloroflexota bacterium]
MDITIEGESHYITESGLVQANCGFDELTQFSEFEYRYLFSRLRRLLGSDVPIRMRAASNPGGLGHDWVRQRFLIEDQVEGRMFIRATLNDNPYLDREEYVRSLQQLDPLTRRQLLEGDWSARAEGRLFRREWLRTTSEPPPGCRWARFWDLAATEPRSSTPHVTSGGSDPDWTAGALVGEADGVFYVADITRLRGRPAEVEELVRNTARRDGVEVAVFMEQEPGASGAALVDHYARRVLKGYAFRGVRHSGSKEVRAAPVSSAAEAGNVRLISGAWIGEFLDEIESFPYGSHDDQVDALCGAIASLARGPLLRPGERAIASSKVSAWTR